jgi:tRNA U34 5-carboxymethylaminomethyl modifying GTPase MnmE/TrmE
MSSPLPKAASSTSGSVRLCSVALDEQIILVDLHRASTALGLLTGAITRDEVFTEIFSKFCIGK